MLQPDEWLREAQVAVPAVARRWKIPAARVLVVDDGPENRELLSLVLAEQGLWVEEAANGQQALDALAATAFDLVLMDMQMPVLDGFAATRQLRERGLQLPVVALTANAMKGYEAEVLEAGCTAYLTKPIDIDLLLETIAGLLGGQAQAAELPLVELAAEGVEALGPVRSRFAANARLSPIVRKFASRLDEQLGLARQAAGGDDFAELARLAHWLAGAAGTMGYDAFTGPARELEACAIAADGKGAGAALQQLLALAARIEIPEPVSP
jgi:CheY-like chemotaxis protein/HPt (histidine-containing phosphotransfer) domain-containing protein